MQRRKFLGLGLAALAVIPAGLSAIDFRQTKPKAWQAVTSKDAIVALYGSDALTKTDKIKLKAPKLAENGGSIPVTIKSKLDLESIAIFQDANPRSAVAVFTVPKDGIINYDLRMKMRKTSKVTIVAKGRDGVLYTTSQNVEVSIGGCGG
jgi:sulfur-oxidizing protein SoxY